MRSFFSSTVHAFQRSPIRRQLLILLVVAQLLAHVSTVLIVSNAFNAVGRVDELRVELLDALTTALTLMDPNDPAAVRAALLPLVDSDSRFVLRGPGGDTSLPLPNIVDLVETELPQGWHGRIAVYDVPVGTLPVGANARPFAVVVDLGYEGYLWFFPDISLISGSLPLIGITMIVMFLAVPLLVITVWSGTYLLRPVERLSEGAQKFSEGAQVDILEETGPREVRAAIRSFNTMQERLQTLIDERGQTLASIGHDLRTPLTRLRLRLENVALGDAATGTERDIRAMEAMIDDALEFLRSQYHRVDCVPVDIASLCETVVTDFTDRGADLLLPSTATDQVVCDIDLTIRALTNIVENAVKFAGKAQVVLRDGGREIAVIDEGPGIPPKLLDVVTRPFNRLGTVSAGAPNAPRGFGLGLAIAEAAMRHQGGVLILEQNSPSGLIARLRLPDGAPPQKNGETT